MENQNTHKIILEGFSKNPNYYRQLDNVTAEVVRDDLDGKDKIDKTAIYFTISKGSKYDSFSYYKLSIIVFEIMQELANESNIFITYQYLNNEGNGFEFITLPLEDFVHLLYGHKKIK